MSRLSETVGLIRSPWEAAFDELVAAARNDLILVSPFVRRRTTHHVLSLLRARNVQGTLRLSVLTDLRPESSLSGSTELEALIDLGRGITNFGLTHLPSLHAKVYVADMTEAIITSANLTESGLSGNLEYGVVLTNESVIAQIRRDFEDYSRLGAKVEVKDLAELLADVQELKKLYEKAERSIRARARQVFRDKLEASRIRLLRHRASGKTTHAIFAETILFILSKGPIRTVHLHPVIQRLHPDLCDDTVDRVIDGVHFGKKWKHYVRNAQQFLKRQGQIEYRAGRWQLAF